LEWLAASFVESGFYQENYLRNNAANEEFWTLVPILERDACKGRGIIVRSYVKQ
jgi:hypothetical protein